LCREKTKAALASYLKNKPLLKKSKLPLRELIMKEYPGALKTLFYF